MNFLINFASRSRPDNFFRAIKSIEDNFSEENSYRIVGSFDLSDSSMYNPDMVEKLLNVKGLTAYFGQSENKVHAINREVPKFGNDWDVLINMSDDMIFTRVEFDKLIAKKIGNDTDQYLHFRDINHRSPNALCTLHIVGRKYFERDGFIYHPDFESLWCDNWNDLMAKTRGKYSFHHEVIFDHKHPAYKKAPRDEQYNKTEDKKVWNRDKAVFNRMKKELQKYV